MSTFWLYRSVFWAVNKPCFLEMLTCNYSGLLSSDIPLYLSLAFLLSVVGNQSELKASAKSVLSGLLRNIPLSLFISSEAMSELEKELNLLRKLHEHHTSLKCRDCKASLFSAQWKATSKVGFPKPKALLLPRYQLFSASAARSTHASDVARSHYLGIRLCPLPRLKSTTVVVKGGYLAHGSFLLGSMSRKSNFVERHPRRSK